MKATALDDLFHWNVYQPDRRLDFNGTYWRRPDGGLLIDPMPLDEEAEAWLADQAGDVKWILLTTADHRRASDRLAERFGARILAPAGDREGLSGLEAEWFGPDRDLPAPLRDDIEVHWLRGGKTEAEAALLLKPLRVMVFGDAVRSHASGVLRLLPDPKVQNRKMLEADVARLAGLDFDRIVLGDGDSMFQGGRDAFTSLLAGFDT